MKASGPSMGAAAKAGVAVVAWGIAAAASAQVVEYYHVDAVGSVRALTSQAGQVIERHDYLPFGEEGDGARLLRR